jgi:hypothetical protein
MTLATKDGSLIVKDGKLAENCGCCGGWYCYNECAEFMCVDAPTASVSLSATDFLVNTIYKYTPENMYVGLPTYWEKETQYFKGSEINGTHVLQKRSDLSSGTQGVWDSSATFWSSCPAGGTSQVARRNIRLTMSSGPFVYWQLSVPVVSFAWYTSDRFSSMPSQTGFKTASDFSCASLCSGCFAVGRQSELFASCNATTGAVSLVRNGFEPVASYPVEFPVGFPAQGMSSDYGRSLEYASGPLSHSWSVHSVSIG